ncbi:protein STICHEL-like [Zingiber officinale]|uniref:protein STICHEL-like n=1 Tax=Zingiber officinale TaxID=94328 RepID=UPI001C4DA56F|nr:protein STICHEL-like [Zingiber officinale]XP_042388196.1 protein STICHEL-like [Zingiber officinale]
MAETCVGPSELHLKKELTALQRARFLRDPETCSSWKSPVSSRSYIATSNLNSRIQIVSGINRKNSKGFEEKSNKVYLYNWKHPSSKCIGGGVKVEENQLSVMESSEDNLSNHHLLDSFGDSYPEVPASIYKLPGTDSETLNSRIDITSRSSKAKKGRVNHAAISTLLDTGNSGEKSDDTDNYKSKDLQLNHELSQRSDCPSHSASPLFSDSGYGTVSCSSKIFRMMQRQGSTSCTPASTNSYYKFGAQNSSMADPCEGTVASFDGDELDHPDLPNGQGCGMSCYWSKRTKYRGGLNSPSLSDTLKRKGSSILYRSHSLYNKRSSSYRKPKPTSKCSQGLPLLNNSCDGGSSSLDTSSDKLSTNIGELDLEAVSRLDGRRWSTCKSQDMPELTRVTRLAEPDLLIEEKRSLSHKYEPRSFDEIIGQNIVIQSLSNAILRGRRIAPAYLFQGPRGTGKTSVARVFTAALNCLSNEEKKPCWLCWECIAFSSRNRTTMVEVNATSKKGLDKLRHSLKNLTLSMPTSRYKVFIIDDCHIISQKIWSLFMKYLDEPIPRVVFIFITSDPANLPHSAISRCQKYNFSKAKEVDIIRRLRSISEQEHLDVDSDAIDLIALNSDGSPRDAESMLEQLSLLGKRITTTLVNDLVGVVSDDKLLDLLEIAMSSDNAETVKRSRELLDSGVDPIALMSQLAGLIVDIIAGTYELTSLQIHDTALGKRSLTEAELDRLKQALKILSDAERQLRHSCERSTWFTAALLQLGASQYLENTQSCNNSKQSTRCSDGMVSGTVYNSRFCKDRRSIDNSLIDNIQANSPTIAKVYTCATQDELGLVWRRCIDHCHSRTLRQLLHNHGRLVSITENEGTLVVLILFENDKIKTRAERFLSSITNSFEIVLAENVKVRMGLLPKNVIDAFSESPTANSTQKACSNKVELGTLRGPSNKGRLIGTSYLSANTMNHSDVMQQAAEKLETTEGFLVPTEGKYGSTQRSQKAIMDEQRLESAWLQAAEKYTPKYINHLKPENNQVWPPQNSVTYQNDIQTLIALEATSKNRIDELDHEIQALKICETEDCHNEQTKGANQYPFSPSLLHQGNQDYKSGPGCNGFLCWKTRKNNSKKVKQGVPDKSKKINGCLSLFGQCGELNLIQNKTA